jgi:hypothetical protein
MNAIKIADEMFANTGHAKLACRVLRAGALREPRFERITEAMAVIHDLPAVGKHEKERYDATKALAQQGIELIRRYAGDLNEADRWAIYEQMQVVLDVRVAREAAS